LAAFLMYINHITLLSGHTSRARREDVTDTTLAVVAPWLLDVVASGQRTPLPVEGLAHYSALALVQDGALVVTVYGPSGPYMPGQPALAGSGIPLVTLGVAQRSRQAAELWPMMVAQFGARAGLRQPQAPWCAVAVHPSMAAHMGAVEWLGDLERCIAWAWVTRRPSLEGV
jgi:hypothetical protein